jgi:hypothetical protein
MDNSLQDRALIVRIRQNVTFLEYLVVIPGPSALRVRQSGHNLPHQDRLSERPARTYPDGEYNRHYYRFAKRQ